MCDVDLARPHQPPVTPADPPLALAVADRVRHAGWGTGVVQRVTADTLTVLFDTAGYKTLAADLVREQALLEKL